MKREEIEKRLKTLPIASWAYPRILLGIPLERSVSHASLTFFRFMEIAAQGVAFIKQDYTRTDLARNRFASELLKSDHTHILMLDLDHTHPADIVQRLARWVMMNPAIQVVGGLNFRRSEPYEPCAFIRSEDGSLGAPADWSAGLIEVDYLGTGSVLIAREVFEQLEPPWFYHIYDHEGKWDDTYPGEDIGFSEKCAAAGIKMYVDTTTTSPHISEKLIGENTFRSYLAHHSEKYRKIEDFKRMKG